MFVKPLIGIMSVIVNARRGGIGRGTAGRRWDPPNDAVLALTNCHAIAAAVGAATPPTPPRRR